VYVDNDPMVYTHSKALLVDAKTTEIVLFGGLPRKR
jgi:hypothetical protein